MRALFVPILLALSTALGADAPAKPAKLTIAEAEKLVRAYVFEVQPAMNPEATFPLNEERVEGLSEKFGCQLYKVTDGVWECASLLVGHGKVQRLGESFGGSGVMSACLADLDGDGTDELVYSFSWGSGIHRSHVAAWKPAANGKGVEVVASLAFLGDLFVRRLGDGTVGIEVGEFKGNLNEWATKGTLGGMKARAVDGGISLDVKLAEPLSKEIRDAIWK
jgi:hypothetical protein